MTICIIEFLAIPAAILMNKLNVEFLELIKWGEGVRGGGNR